ncbi:copper-binding protein [Brackiella oedipodis]|uniref:copper-binding protein n=1 Tax=Brackiella oedipodis TaxID=124225 RepID=UPI00048C2D1A|nr:copper-binding protein [Brackiella oedipodis]
MKKLLLSASLLLGLVPLLANAQEASAKGEVRRLDPKAGTVAIKADAIADLNLPAMTLVYQVDGSKLQGIKAGDTVRFTVKHEGNEYRITEIKK